ncbi:MAG: hypothetical protein Q8Q55_00230, partial [Undibacterium sp.]|nr:hypothetical protein [Undibacterium sp.]
MGEKVVTPSGHWHQIGFRIKLLLPQAGEGSLVKAGRTTCIYVATYTFIEKEQQRELQAIKLWSLGDERGRAKTKSRHEVGFQTSKNKHTFKPPEIQLSGRRSRRKPQTYPSMARIYNAELLQKIERRRPLLSR